MQFTSKLRNLKRKQKLSILFINDIFIAFFCWLVFGPPMSFMVATNFTVNLSEIILSNIVTFIIPSFLLVTYFLFSGFYRSTTKFFDSKDSILRALFGSCLFGFSWGFVYLFQYQQVLTSFIATVALQSLLLSSVLYAFIQISRDIARLMIYPSKVRSNGKPVLIYGAGSAGNELYHAIKQNADINIIGFFDNSLKLKGAEINNIKIFWKGKHIQELSNQYSGLEIYLAIPSLTTSERRKIISSLEPYKIAVRSMPALHEVVADEKKLAEMQDLSIDDILPRERVPESLVSFDSKVVLITGAGGSIGSEIVRQILFGNPKKIILFELSEINLYSIESNIEAIKRANNITSEVIGILGDVKDTNRLERIIRNHQVGYIYHAAAYKHVPIVEYYENISEGVKNNIFGTKSVCDAAIACEVERVVIISTDKAVRPTNIMGASKRFAEMIAQSMDKNSNKTKFCMVRFGNVLNSSGSVIPLFKKQIANGGPITITHKDVTRFFMTISEASSLVIQAGEYSEGGDVFILDMGEQVRIMDLAERIIYLSGRNINHGGLGEGIEIKEVGLRPGEKLYEELLISGEELKTPNSKIFKSIENCPTQEIIDDALKILFNSIQTNNVKAIKSVLKEHVEGFNSGKTQ
mgnify:FL=1|tara:strand:+ start:2122 stop:4029 length:1908 start_codon:yes stop_codon:yes gene_type:complete